MSEVAEPTAPTDGGKVRAGGLVIREIPFVAILVLTVLGVGYVAMTRHAIPFYWQGLAVFIAVVAIAIGWRRAETAGERWHVIWTQCLHWGAFLVVMNLVFLPSVQAITNADATSLTILLLLALGTFTAGVHTPSWHMCFNGVVMALSVPAIAWLDQSALLMTLGVLVVLSIAVALTWRRFKG